VLRKLDPKNRLMENEIIIHCYPFSINY